MTWLIHFCYRTRPHDWALISCHLLTRSSTCEYDMAHSNVWHDSRIRHNSFKCVTWLNDSSTTCEPRFRVVCWHKHLDFVSFANTIISLCVWHDSLTHVDEWRHRVYVVTWNLSGDMTSMWCHDSHTDTQLTHTTSHTCMGTNIECMSWHEIYLVTWHLCGVMTHTETHNSLPRHHTRRWATT